MCLLTTSFFFSSISTHKLPDLIPQLGMLYQLMESRVKTLQKLSRLHGRLFILVTQVSFIYITRDLQGCCLQTSLPVGIASAVICPGHFNAAVVRGC